MQKHVHTSVASSPLEDISANSFRDITLIRTRAMVATMPGKAYLKGGDAAP